MTGPAVRYLRPPESLRAKATRDLDDVAGLDPAGFAAAEAVLEARTTHYPQAALTDVDILERCLENARAKIVERAGALANIARTANTMRCHGSTYGYPLVTKIAWSLYEYARKAVGSEEQLEVIEAHAKALRVVVGENLTGDGGPVGREVVDSLRQAVEGVPAERRRT
ncbi:MAG: hypothetical protein VCC99_09240 [Alphaproteobacteria bacterium]